MKEKVEEKRGALAYWLSSNSEILCPTGYVPLARNEEVRKNVHKIADLVSSMTIMLMENGENGDKRVKNELAKKIDVYPNKYMVRKNFIYKIVTDMIINGNSVVYPQYSGELLEDLKIWNADSLMFSPQGDGYSIGYNGQTFHPNEVLHFSLIPDDNQPWRGSGYGSMMKNALQIGRAHV